MLRRSPSHDVKTQPNPTVQNAFEVSPDDRAPSSSKKFITPPGYDLDFVSASRGGIFYGIVRYGDGVIPSLPKHIPHIEWVEDYVTTSINNLISGDLSATYIRSLFSSTSNVLTYNATNGQFSLNRNLSAYTNDAGFITSGQLNETDPVWTAQKVDYYKKTEISGNGTAAVHFNNITNKPTTLKGYEITNAMSTAHPANVITATNISNWNTAFGWGNHATEGYLKTYDETDPVWISEKSDYYTKINLQTSGEASVHFNNITNTPTTLDGYNITDGMDITHPAYFISTVDIDNWNDAFAWGDNPSTLQELGFPAVEGSLTYLRISDLGALEFHAIEHADLSQILGDGAYHLSLTQFERVTTPASEITDGYLTKEDFATLASAGGLTAGNLISINNKVIDVDSNVRATDDNVVATDKNWSSTKIALELAKAASGYEYLSYVDAMQVDATLDPTLTTGKRYIILDILNINTNFKGSYASIIAWVLALGISNNDIVEYDGTDFIKAFDSETATTAAVVTVGVDKFANNDYVWVYSPTRVEWGLRGYFGEHDAIPGVLPDPATEGAAYHINLAQRTILDDLDISAWTNDAGYITDITGGNLDDLADVTITTPQNKDVIKYDSVAGEYVNGRETLLEEYAAITIVADVAEWDCNTGLNKTLTATASFELFFENVINGDSGDLVITLTGVDTDIELLTMQPTILTRQLSGTVTTTNASDVIDTTEDLTSEISIGDYIKIDSGIPAGFEIFGVVDIDSTTITLDSAFQGAGAVETDAYRDNIYAVGTFTELTAGIYHLCFTFSGNILSVSILKYPSYKR